MPDSLAQLERDVVGCTRCARLRKYCAEIGVVKRRAYRDEEYWAKPVPSFGDPGARLLIVGLAPGAHGANRTGRMFTGDKSGEFLYRALYETGFASQPESLRRGDGMQLRDCWITAPVHCAPPDNKPTPREFARCRPYLEREVNILAANHLRVVVCLGRLGFDAYLTVVQEAGRLTGSRSGYAFGHGVVHRSLDPAVVCSYHPSQQNTSTGRLTREMLRSVFETARSLIST